MRRRQEPSDDLEEEQEEEDDGERISLADVLWTLAIATAIVVTVVTLSLPVPEGPPRATTRFGR